MDAHPPEVEDCSQQSTAVDFIVAPEQEGIRFDRLLSLVHPALSRNLIIASIRNGLVTVDGEKRKSSYRLKAGQRAAGAIVVPSQEIDILPQPIDFPILYEDSAVLLISKPPGLVVHPGAGHRQSTLVNGLLHHCQQIEEAGDAARPGIVHRLDKDTSGVMIIAKTNAVHRRLVEDFKRHRLEKVYLVLVHGCPPETAGRIVAPIGRHQVHRKKMAVMTETGRHAASSWERLADFDRRHALLRVTIETGRTHQIRVHLSHSGYPVAGDGVYGSSRDNRAFPRQMLHAYRLSFHHPVSGERIDCTAPLWSDFRDILYSLGWQGTL